MKVKNRVVLDWLSATSNQDIRTKLPFKFRRVKGIGNYPSRWQTDFGLWVGVNTEDMRQGWHINASGEPLGAMRDMGFTDQYLIDLIIPNVRKVSRLDTAMDIAYDVKLSDLDHDVPYIKTRLARTGGVDGQECEGWTQYFGSKDSDVRIRFYDKASELSLLSQSLTRVESQTRNKYATQLANDYRKYKDIEATYKAWLWSRMKIYRGWYLEAINGKGEFGKVQRRDTNYWLYLQQVLNSVENKLNENEKIGEIHHFAKLLAEVIETDRRRRNW